MKIDEAMKIINDDKEEGYMVSFEWAGDGMLRSDHFPDKHAGEKLIETEEEAWELAAKFASRKRDRCVNIYITGADFHPVKGYRDRIILNR